jgi:probable addiction module antidote protein
MNGEKVTFEAWDLADDIETKEDVIGIIGAAIEENDPEFLLSVIGDIARSKGMSQLARELNMDRAGLYRSFSPDGNPYFLTVIKVLDHLGFRLSIQRKQAS